MKYFRTNANNAGGLLFACDLSQQFGAYVPCIQILFNDAGYKNITYTWRPLEETDLEITEAEFYDAFHKSHFAMLEFLGGPNACALLNAANTRLISSQSGAEP
jgi:hypothetical protein